ncbi:DNA polymerase IV [Dissulfurirhabdus thermomarina]|uniref:DNA polymerase IV n=1 Tax=Dissulfurirhabdus thermomarina TaxID=1765737 RepID=A0A6N9TK52_DISTH|nr:DNA polymerase IV [Dissulfurirhabdus thermomarina]NDY41642.1 DNA polymerase IV [Dissulfurirhabdus thermomarina]NMX24334.1 DNA polymerase IV [Dissulfurirhabdus thermomarina]
MDGGRDRELRCIVHLDMDAFFASVEALDRPELRGRPVIVGGTGPRGVVAAASYEARRHGVHSAMPMTRARRLCPGAVVLPPRAARYREVSRAVFEIFRSFTPLVEPVSIDEAFLDLTGTEALHGPPAAAAAEIRRRVRGETGLTVSAGVAPNKLLAKIASDLGKPDGLVVVPPGREQEFLDPLPVGRIWGVGEVTRRVLGRMGVRTVRDLRALDREGLVRRFGAAGHRLYLRARGRDASPVAPPGPPKSVGREETFPRDLRGEAALRPVLLRLAGEVGRRLRRRGLAGRTVVLKVRFGDFSTVTRSVTLPAPVDDDGAVFHAGLELLGRVPPERPVRLLGLTVTGFGPEGAWRQLSLFGGPGAAASREALNRALDRLRERYGGDVVVPGSLLPGGEEGPGG